MLQKGQEKLSRSSIEWKYEDAKVRSRLMRELDDPGEIRERREYAYTGSLKNETSGQGKRIRKRKSGTFSQRFSPGMTIFGHPVVRVQTLGLAVE